MLGGGYSKEYKEEVRMKIKRMLIYGILLLFLFATLIGCSGKADLEDQGNMATPEDIVLAYVQGFSQEDFTGIESLFDESQDLGDIYFTEAQGAPKDTMEMIKSQHQFVTHFYGHDAWTNVEYELEEIAAGNDGTLETDSMANPDSDAGNEADSDMDVETGAIKEYLVNFIFNETPLHLMGFENLHIILSNESGAWLIKEGLSWDVNLYGGGPTPKYFQGNEAAYRTIDRDHRLEDVTYVLGETMNREESIDDGYASLVLRYSDATYYFYTSADEEGFLIDRYTLDGMIVESGDYPMLRDIKLGDSFYDTMSKFPRERDWLSDPENVFYGTGTKYEEDFGGTCISWVEEDGTTYDNVTLKDEESVATIRLEFMNGTLKLMELFYITYL